MILPGDIPQTIGATFAAFVGSDLTATWDSGDQKPSPVVVGPADCGGFHKSWEYPMDMDMDGLFHGKSMKIPWINCRNPLFCGKPPLRYL